MLICQGLYISISLSDIGIQFLFELQILDHFLINGIHFQYMFTMQIYLEFKFYIY